MVLGGACTRVSRPFDATHRGALLVVAYVALAKERQLFLARTSVGQQTNHVAVDVHQRAAAREDKGQVMPSKVVPPAHAVTRCIGRRQVGADADARAHQMPFAAPVTPPMYRADAPKTHAVAANQTQIPPIVHDGRSRNSCTSGRFCVRCQRLVELRGVSVAGRELLEPHHDCPVGDLDRVKADSRATSRRLRDILTTFFGELLLGEIAVSFLPGREVGLDLVAARIVCVAYTCCLESVSTCRIMCMGHIQHIQYIYNTTIQEKLNAHATMWHSK
mmetsp:Transcript_38368/g.61852  ORF Transcript_38368/g.61852 Transcript_38368/m.61852 type:complete len:275 (-) Transcript_38368:426-1250(-)